MPDSNNKEILPCREAYEKWCKENHLVDTAFASWAIPDTRSICWEAWQASWNHNPAIKDNSGLVEELNRTLSDLNNMEDMEWKISRVRKVGVIILLRKCIEALQQSIAKE